MTKSAQVLDERFKRLIAVQAQYIFDTFGKFPATVPSVYILLSAAQHIDTEYYDKLFKPGAYLPTHARHHAYWHAGDPQA